MITIVSGLPRSGTSLVMQMLAAGGFPILTDGVRAADDDNPKGYLEFERVKSLERDQSWLPEAEGKAVKIISFLLPKLPPTFDYQVIFVHRDLNEVLRSQQQMLTRRAQPPGPSDDVMRAHFERHLEQLKQWCKNHPNFRVLDCQYQQIVADPHQAAQSISEFVGIPLKVESMTNVVDPTLYRQRNRI